MSKTIEISHENFDKLAEVAEWEKRTLRQQADYWIDLSYTLDHMDLHIEDGRVEIPAAPAELDAGGLEVDELSIEEMDAFFAAHQEFLEQPVYADDFFSERVARGVGVGALEDGTLVRQVAGGGLAAF